MELMTQDCKKSGIYIIEHLPTGRKYVGSAKRFITRWRIHLSQLNRGTHHSKYLQRVWNKYPEDQFNIYILEIVDNLDDLLSWEQATFDLFSPVFNVCQFAGNTLGYKMTPEQTDKWRESRKGYIPTEETRALKSKINKELGIAPPSWKGKKHSFETLLKMSEAQKGKIISVETLEKLRLSHLGIKQSEETIAKRVAKITGKKRTPEQVARLAAANTGKTRTEEQKQAQSERMTGVKRGPHSEETKAKMREKALGRVIPQEQRDKIRQTLLAKNKPS